MMNLALRPSNFNFIYDASKLIKRDLLYFDQVHICSYNNFTIFDEIKSTDPEYYIHLERELKLFKENNLFFDKFYVSEVIKHSFNLFKKQESTSLDDFNDIKKVLDMMKNVPQPLSEKKFKEKLNESEMLKIMDEYEESVNSLENEATKIAAFFLNRFAVDDAFPLLETYNTIAIRNSVKTNVLEVVLNKLPIPNEDVSNEQIIEFRSDPDSRAKFNALRVWMQDISRKDYSHKEINERIEHLVYEYETHLRLHKLKFGHGSMRVFVTSALEVLENLATLKLSKVVDSIYSLQTKEINLLEAQLTAPGKEVAYIIDANNKLGR
ncbi:hypothetical protein [Bizionia sp.]|uniref:hypothetical protein n=1 Tax=Bizionia sp. TaxID=1954480 RepID=UPI003A948F67